MIDKLIEALSSGSSFMAWATLKDIDDIVQYIPSASGYLDYLKSIHLYEIIGNADRVMNTMHISVNVLGEGRVFEAETALSEIVDDADEFLKIFASAMRNAIVRMNKSLLDFSEEKGIGFIKDWDPEHLYELSSGIIDEQMVTGSLCDLIDSPAEPPDTNSSDSSRSVEIQEYTIDNADVSDRITHSRLCSILLELEGRLSFIMKCKRMFSVDISFIGTDVAGGELKVSVLMDSSSMIEGQVLIFSAGAIDRNSMNTVSEIEMIRIKHGARIPEREFLYEGGIGFKAIANTLDYLYKISIGPLKIRLKTGFKDEEDFKNYV